MRSNAVGGGVLYFKLGVGRCSYDASTISDNLILPCTMSALMHVLLFRGLVLYHRLNLHNTLCNSTISRVNFSYRFFKEGSLVKIIINFK